MSDERIKDMLRQMEKLGILNRPIPVAYLKPDEAKRRATAQRFYDTRRLARFNIPLGPAQIEATEYSIWLREQPGFTCVYCERPVPAIAKRRQVDHVVPLAQNGAHEIHNLVPSCQQCNSLKYDRLVKHKPRVEPSLNVSAWRATNPVLPSIETYPKLKRGKKRKETKAKRIRLKEWDRNWFKQWCADR